MIAAVVTLDHAEQLLLHWAREHARTASLYAAWHANQGSGLVVHTVDRSRERNVRTMTLSWKGRARTARRLIAQAQLTPEGKPSPIPDWAGGDPMRCKESRSKAAPTWPLDSVSQQVDDWVTSLWRWDPRAALALRAHYRLGMNAGEGARWVAQASELNVGRHGYMAGIARGKLFIKRCAEDRIKTDA